MDKENPLQDLKRLESFIKESMPRYKTLLFPGKLYVETIFSKFLLQVGCPETIIDEQGVSYLIYLIVYPYEERTFEVALIDGFDKEDQLRKFFKELYDEEVRLEDKYISRKRTLKTLFENSKKD